MNLKQALVIVISVFVFQFSQAQSHLKIGHVNIQEIVQKHPAVDSIRTIMDKETKGMEELYNEMLQEHDSKLKVFEQEEAGYSELVRKSKEKELLEIAQKIQEYNQTAQQQLQQRNMELLKPIYDNVNSLIKDIADHNQFTYILDISVGAVAYVSPTSENITPLVLEKLKK